MSGGRIFADTKVTELNEAGMSLGINYTSSSMWTRFTTLFGSSSLNVKTAGEDCNKCSTLGSSSPRKTGPGALQNTCGRAHNAARREIKIRSSFTSWMLLCAWTHGS